MSFLTKKEQSSIKIIQSSTLPADAADKLIEEIKFNARLRQDGYRKKVKIFLSVMSSLRNDKLIQKIK